MTKKQKSIVAKQVESIAGRPLTDTPDGPLYVAFDADDGTIYAGSVCGNFGAISKDFSVEYDIDSSLDQNLQNLMEKIEEAA